MKTYLNYGVRQTPQTEPIPGSSQTRNDAGGYTWTVSDWTRLRRFLVLGSEGGCYYASERKLTRDNLDATIRCIAADGPRVVAEIVAVSEEGRAPKNDPALFALAVAASLGDTATRQAAVAALPRVARTGTHLFHFLSYAQEFRGWGRGLRRGVSAWYRQMEPERLALQLVKYVQRDGWTHRDVIRKAHPHPGDDPVRQALFRWAVNGPVRGDPFVGDTPPDVPALRLVWAYEQARRAKRQQEIVRLIRDYRLPREAIPTEFLSSRLVWEALLDSMPMEAMVRNLPTMTRVGLIAPLATATRLVVDRLGDQAWIRAARLHPFKVLVAHLTYAAGRSMRGDATWRPVPQVTDALDAAFYAAFGNVEPTGKRLVLAIDCSGSMTGGMVAGVPGMTPMRAAAAMALVTAATERQWVCVAWATTHRTLDISPRMRLEEVVRRMQSTDVGVGTDAAQVIAWANDNGVTADAFVVYTDNQSWAGDIHLSQALRRYRERRLPGARLVTVGMVANSPTLADPNDPGMLDVVGFDTATPDVISDFIRA